MKTKVLALAVVMTLLSGAAAVHAVLPNTPGYDSMVLVGVADSDAAPITTFYRISRNGSKADSPFVIPSGKVLMITEFTFIGTAGNSVSIEMGDNPVLVVDISTNKNFNMTTGFMVSKMTALKVDDISGGIAPAIILRGYIMPKPAP